MNPEQFFKNLTPPTGAVDVVLDTDAYNEIDDQFAISYLLRSQDKLNIKGFCAAPFSGNRLSTGPLDGMEKSYNELLNLLTLAGEEKFKEITFRGSTEYLPDENTPVESDAANFMAELANNYSPENPLYIVAIGAITNVASAILKNPAMKENCVIVWLGGHATHWHDTPEFNMVQDIAAARIIFGCGVPFVQLPCMGVVSSFYVSKPELIHHLEGKNAICDYLVSHTIEIAEFDANYRPVWTRVLWDVTAVAWLLNGNGRFMHSKLIHAPIPEYDNHYAYDDRRHFMNYVYHIHRDTLFTDLFEKLAKTK